jgi:hypothetical protein
MTITVKKEITETHEITLPAYYKSKTMLYHFKIYSKTNCIAVTSDEIAIKHASLPFALDNLQLSNADEFLTAFNNAKSNIEQSATQN